MRTSEERIALLHRRSAQLKRERDRKALRGFGGVSAALFSLLLVCMVRINGVSGVAGGGMTGSSLLDESAGGYVLAAIIAFFGGVIITSVIYRRRKK